jgi:hypothetical protein
MEISLKIPLFSGIFRYEKPAFLATATLDIVLVLYYY